MLCHWILSPLIFHEKRHLQLMIKQGWQVRPKISYCFNIILRDMCKLHLIKYLLDTKSKQCILAPYLLPLCHGSLQCSFALKFASYHLWSPPLACLMPVSEQSMRKSFLFLNIHQHHGPAWCFPLMTRKTTYSVSELLAWPLMMMILANADLLVPQLHNFFHIFMIDVWNVIVHDLVLQLFIFLKFFHLIGDSLVSKLMIRCQERCYGGHWWKKEFSSNILT